MTDKNVVTFLPSYPWVISRSNNRKKKLINFGSNFNLKLIPVIDIVNRRLLIPSSTL